MTGLAQLELGRLTLAQFRIGQNKLCILFHSLFCFGHQGDLSLNLTMKMSTLSGGASENLPVDAGDMSHGLSLSWEEDPLEKEMAAHSSSLAWRIP